MFLKLFLKQLCCWINISNQDELLKLGWKYGFLPSLEKSEALDASVSAQQQLAEDHSLCFSWLGKPVPVDCNLLMSFRHWGSVICYLLGLLCLFFAIYLNPGSIWVCSCLMYIPATTNTVPFLDFAVYYCLNSMPLLRSGSGLMLSLLLCLPTHSHVKPLDCSRKQQLLLCTPVGVLIHIACIVELTTLYCSWLFKQCLSQPNCGFVRKRGYSLSLFTQHFYVFNRHLSNK